MLLAHRDVDTGKLDQEVELEWGGSSGFAIILRVRESADRPDWSDTGFLKAEAVLAPDDCRALAAVLLEMADRFEKER